MIAGSAGVEWLDADEPELIEIETVDEHVDCSHRVFLGHIIIERRWKEAALFTIHPFNKALHRLPCKIAGNLNPRIAANRAFSHSLGHELTLVDSFRYFLCAGE